jgi:hypothetical protein
MKRPRVFAASAVAIVAALMSVSSAGAGTAPRDPNLNGGFIPSPLALPDAPNGEAASWVDHFDLYTTGSQMHGQGGWAGWDNSPGAGALTSSTQARTAANSVDILGPSDLVRTYTGYTSGTWTYSIWQYIPSTVTGNTYFILLNRYEVGGTNNWSTQLCFDATADVVRDDIPGNCTGSTTLPIVYDQWVEIRVVIDLDTNAQTLFYGGQQLYSATWTGHISNPTGSQMAIAAVDLFANGATSVFYDDAVLIDLDFFDGFESGDTRDWTYYQP